MTQANDSILVTPGSGATVATHLANSKEYQVVMPARPSGHVIGSLAEWFVWFTPTTNANAREVAEVFNADATIKVFVRGIWIVPTQTAITGVQIGFDINKISSVGTTGSTTMTPRAADSTQSALDADITARIGSTAGATLAHLLWQVYFFNDDTNASTPLQATYNQIPEQGDYPVDLVLNQNEGIQVKQSVAATVGLTGCLIYFATDQ